MSVNGVTNSAVIIGQRVKQSLEASCGQSNSLYVGLQLYDLATLLRDIGIYRLDVHIRRLLVVDKLHEILTSNSLKFYLVLVGELDPYTSGSCLLRYYLFIILVDAIDELVLSSCI